MVAIAVKSDRANGRVDRPIPSPDGRRPVFAQPSKSHRPLPPGLYHALVTVVAHQLWRQHGGNDVLNWLEAEILVQNALDSHRFNIG